ncbi:MAG: CotH kinase family protein [Flavobacteriales bacterium]|nr:CotH kinase family protein [Flavobacteriales bacterium]
MRLLPVLLLVLYGAFTSAQPGLLINEVCASNHGNFIDAEGRTPDWIELYNTGAKAIDLASWRIAINGRQHVLDAALLIPPRTLQLLLCDGKPNRGPDHLGFTLPRTGGAILLIAPDGTTIADLFTYPALPANAGIGRLPDGAKEWSWFEHPTPGAPNRSAALHAIHGRSSKPELTLGKDDSLHVAAPSAGTMHYTLDGSDSRRQSTSTYTHPLSVAPGTVIRACAIGAGKLPSAEVVLLVPAHGPRDARFVLAMDPADLWGDSLGIYHPGSAQNHTRRGRDWEREAMLLTGDEAVPVGARLFGSGSRGAGKRSFKLYARSRYESPEKGFAFTDCTHMHEGILRADAGPHAFLRNTVIEQLVERFGLQVEVQPSVAEPLYLNGAYWGLYRWMPAKDAEWLKQRCGAESLDVLEGPAMSERSGKDTHFLHAQRLLLNGAPFDSIAAAIDVGSLIDLACIDLWTGRADHDLNVRCFRPRQPGGRWRWVLFDMDLWSTPGENSVERMCSATLPETPFVPPLMQHPRLQELLLARMTALQAAAFPLIPELADSLYRAHSDDLIADHKRWELQLESPHPEASLSEVKAFATLRPQHLFAHLARRTGRKIHVVRIEAPPVELGQLLVEGLLLRPGKHEVRCFSGVPVSVEARPAHGVEFTGWSGSASSESSMRPDLSKMKKLSARFRVMVP